jgi:hypothetical protein
MHVASAFAVCAHRGSSTPDRDQHSSIAPISPMQGLASNNFFGLTLRALSFMKNWKSNCQRHNKNSLPNGKEVNTCDCF